MAPNWELGMSDLDDRIAELQAQLAHLQEERRTRMQRYGSEFRQEKTDYFSVITSEELSLAALPELARLILDALPVQVFIKQAAPEENGRRYTYINQRARAILGWSEDKAKSAYDSEAFAGGTNSPEWQKMFTGETETLQSRRARRRELSWTASTKHGEAWRLNRVTEIPILITGFEDPIGFCAIAEDIEFQLFSATHSQLRRIFRHEYGNLSASVLRYVKSAQRQIRRIQQPGSVSNNLDAVLEDLQKIEGLLLVAANMADALYMAVGHIDEHSESTVERVAEEINYLFERAPFKVMVKIDDATRFARLRKPEAVKGLLVELIGNAEKHYDESANEIEIPVIASFTDGNVVWEVSNRCGQLKGSLDFGTSLTSESSGETRERFGARIIGDIIKRAYGADPSDMIEFPTALTDDGWVNVKLRCQIMEDS